MMEMLYFKILLILKKIYDNTNNTPNGIIKGTTKWQLEI